MTICADRKRADFTLIEVMLALAILGLLGLVLATSLGIFIDGYRRNQLAAAELERNLAIDRFANTVLAQAVPCLWIDRDAGETKTLFSGDYDELWVAAVRPADAGGAFLFVRLYVEEEELRCDWSRTPLAHWQEIGRQKFTTETVAAGVERIEFRYAAFEDDEIAWHNFWSEDDREEDIPRAIELIVHSSDGSTERWLRRRAGVGDNTVFSTGGD